MLIQLGFDLRFQFIVRVCEVLNEIASKLLAESIEFVYIMKSFFRGVSFFDRHLAQNAHDIGKLDILGASGVADVTTLAHPDYIGTQNSLAHAENGHPYDFSRIVVFVDFGYRATGSACPACETQLEILGTGPRSHFFFEFRILLTQNDCCHFISLFLNLFGNVFNLSEGEHRAVHAYILGADVASAAFADTALHSAFEGRVNPLGRKTEFA